MSATIIRSHTVFPPSISANIGYDNACRGAQRYVSLSRTASDSKRGVEFDRLAAESSKGLEPNRLTAAPNQWRSWRPELPNAESPRLGCAHRARPEGWDGAVADRIQPHFALWDLPSTLPYDPSRTPRFPPRKLSSGEGQG